MATKIELWEGYKVEVNEQLLDDFDFQQDLAEAQRENDLPSFISMIFAIIGGDKVYDDVREHIIKEKGYFSTDSVLEIVTKIGEAAFPKAGNRAQKRSWQTSK
jgi:hypothetical protein